MTNAASCSSPKPEPDPSFSSLLCCVVRYYIDRHGTQKGPAMQSAIKADWREQQVDGECIAWNSALEGWVKINTLPALETYLKA